MAGIGLTFQFIEVKLQGALGADIVNCLCAIMDAICMHAIRQSS